MRERESTDPQKYYIDYWTEDTQQIMRCITKNQTLAEAQEFVSMNNIAEYRIYYERVVEVIMQESCIGGSYFDRGVEPE
jgi:hypothetical protein